MRSLIPQIDLPFLTVATTPLLVLLFIAIVWWVYRAKRKPIYHQIERMPLEEE